MTSTFTSPFLQAVSRPREKGFAESIVEDITNISAKQAVALPLTLPLHAGAGALEGLSFGLLSPTDELETFLGEYAPPKPLQTGAEIAGVIGGSFVPYIGASRVAAGVFEGIGLGSRIARGAFTFGAPEVIRQALAQEVDPQHVGRALSTGAAFSLPLPRALLAPVVGGTELLLGASPMEAGVSAGFAALFGAMGDEALKAVKGAAPPIRPVRGLLVGGSKLSPAPSAPKSQVELILETVGKSDLPEARVSLQQLAANVKALANEPEEALSNALLKSIDTLGPEASQTKGLQYALAQKRQGFVPPGAAVVNRLKPPTSGIELITSGPTNPFEMRAMHETVLSNLRASGGPVGHTKAAQLEQLMYEARQEAARIKGRGQTITPQRIAEIQAPQDAIMASREVKFRDDADALRSAMAELGKTINSPDVEAFLARLPEYYQRGPEFVEQLRRAGAERQRILDRVVKPVLALPAKTPGFERLEKALSDYGASVDVHKGRIRIRLAGQGEKTFASPKVAEEWIQSLETGMSPAVAEVMMLPRTQVEGYAATQVQAPGELVESIRQQGIREPLEIGVGPTGQRTLFEGKHRLAAARELGIENVPTREVPIGPGMEEALRREPGSIRRVQLDFNGKNFRFTDDAGSTMDVVLPGGEVKVGDKVRVVPEGHLYTRNVNIAKPSQGKGLGSQFARARGELMREFGITKTLGKVTSDKPGAIFRMREISEEIARGDVVRNVHELRMLAHSRGMVVDFDGKALNITNQLTGETVRGLGNLKEAAEAIRSAPNVAVAAREIGPQVPGAPTLPGAGSLHGLGSEQPPPFCPLQLPTE